MMLCISVREGIVVSYLRLIFCTPRPMLEASSVPNLRRVVTCALEGVLFVPAALGDVLPAVGNNAPPAIVRLVFRRLRRFISKGISVSAAVADSYYCLFIL